MTGVGKSATTLKSRKISEVYSDPLPYKLKSLPVLIAHNPVSVIYFAWCLFCTANPQQTVHTAYLSSKEGAITISVRDPESMNALWQMGFFGKGTFSRSEPSWFGRTNRRLGLLNGELTFEEITEERRRKRREFKFLRYQEERQRLLEQFKAEDNEEAYALLSEIYVKEQAKFEQSQFVVSKRPEDEAIIDGESVLPLEALELTPYEMLFLNASLGVLEVVGDGHKIELPQLLETLFGENTTTTSFAKYIAYHYFRSQNWCPRSGVKFGTDLILYSRGPPFQHAEFAVNVVTPNADPLPWYKAQSTARVVGSVQKRMLYAYIEGPDMKSLNWTEITTPYKLRKVLEQYTVQCVGHARWAPTRTRD